MSSTPTRRYVVFSRNGLMPERMIQAPNPHAAVAHVARGMLDSRLATADDIERLVSKGVRTEKLGDAPAGTAPADQQGPGPGTDTSADQA